MKYQVCRPLTPIEYEALKVDIAENGILVPVEVDENGDILDGHHRVQAWEELRAEGVDLPQYAKLIRQGMTEEQKRNHARKLNVLRRQMDEDERKRIWADMKLDGMSYPAIVATTGVPYGTVYRGVNEVIQLDNLRLPPANGIDGKTYPAQQPKISDSRRFVWEFDTIDYGQSEKSYPLTAANHTVSSDPDYDGDEWYTPPEYIEAARAVLGEIDFDPASCADANVVVKANFYLTKEDDSLRGHVAWNGRVWLNPPYSMPLIKYFVAKLITQYNIGNVTEAIILTNNSSDTAWFQSLLSHYPACFTRGRAQFWRPDSATFGARQGQTLFYLGDNFEAFKRVFSEIGQIVVHA